MERQSIMPDVESSSEDYARRFSGDAGAYFLDVQGKSVDELLRSCPSKLHSIVDVGGGHAQLTALLLRHAEEVIVHGSSPECRARVEGYLQDYADRMRFVTSPLLQLPLADQSVDVAVAIRMLAHIENWPAFLGELTRVSRYAVIVDYASLIGFNILTPLLFQIKKRMEGNTRPYLCQWTGEVRRTFQAHGFGKQKVLKQFFFPMGVHRALRNKKHSERMESFARTIGLTRAFGAPGLMIALRTDGVER